MANPESIAREAFEAINRNDMATFKSLLHPDYSYRGPDGQVQSGGPDAGIAVVQMYRTAFPDDMKADVQRVHSSGDTAIVEFIGTGTHKGDLAGIAPTGRKVEMPIITVLEIKDGKVYAEREYMDSAYMMQQLGVVPAPAIA
jgi:steroid delta-isomerase-like uncharacterized protein